MAWGMAHGVPMFRFLCSNSINPLPRAPCAMQNCKDAKHQTLKTKHKDLWMPY